MKKTWFLAGLLALTVGLSACGAQGGESASESAAETSAAVSTEEATEVSQAGSTSSEQGTEQTKVDPKRQVYVSASWVKDAIEGKMKDLGKVVLLQVGWGNEQQDASYVEHIPGAVHLNTDDIEESENWNYRSPEELGSLMKKYGITKDTTVIVYGNKGEDSADDRAALALLYAGVENVKALDGGLAKWQEAGYPMEKTPNAPAATEEEFGTTIPAHPEWIVTMDDVLQKVEKDLTFKLISIRSYDEFVGKTSGYTYIDRAGEPKGAIWGHDTDDGSYLKEDGTTVGSDVLLSYIQPYGAALKDQLVFYCGTGWRAAIPFLICYQEGMDNMRLYDAGWFVYQKEPENIAQIGDPLKGDVKFVSIKELATDKAKKAN